jgi:hypothetical protein
MNGKIIGAEMVSGSSSTEVNLFVHPGGIDVIKSRKTIGSYPWNEISELEVDGPDTVQKRVTASRLILTGPLAFAFKKKTGEAFLFLSFQDGREAQVYRFPKKSEPELKAIFAPFKSKVSPSISSQANASGNQVDMTAQLEKLADLFGKGLINEEEFKASKAKILGLE